MTRRPYVALAVAVLAATVSACASPAANTAGPPTTRVVSPVVSSPAGAVPSATTATTAAAPSRAPAPTGSPPEQPTDRRGTGITGQILIDGGCPVLRAESPCPNRPVAATLTLLDSATNAVRATFATDAQGHFTVTAAPGSYLLRADLVAARAPRRPGTMPVTVTAGRYTPVTMLLDSGIR